MPLLVNCRHLETHNVHFQGEMPVAELDLEVKDEIIQTERPLEYDLQVEKFEGGLLVTGGLQLDLHCQCVRCLKTFTHRLYLNHWTRHLPLEGEESVPVVNDCVDLTPGVREDILLEFPRHPLCRPDCPGLEKAKPGKAQNPGGQDELAPSAWAELDKLKL